MSRSSFPPRVHLNVPFWVNKLDCLPLSHFEPTQTGTTFSLKDITERKYYQSMPAVGTTSSTSTDERKGEGADKSCTTSSAVSSLKMIPSQLELSLADILDYDPALGPWETVILSNYMTDLEFLFHEVPSLIDTKKEIIVLYGEHEETMHQQALQRMVDLGQIPKKHKVRFVKPMLPIPYGTHHSKMALCFHSCGSSGVPPAAAGVRVAIFTANFIYADWHRKNQGIYLQDFPLKRMMSKKAEEQRLGGGGRGATTTTTTTTMQQGISSQMEIDLLHYFRMIGGWDAQQIADYDFSAAMGSLVFSLPGYHQVSSSASLPGMAMLQTVLSRDVVLPALPSNQVILTGQTWQYSSQGSFGKNGQFLFDFTETMNTSRSGGNVEEITRGNETEDAGKNIQDKKMPSAKLKKKGQEESSSWRHHEVAIVYPTVEEVKNSVEGWRAGVSIPVRQKNAHELVNERLHKWEGTSDGAPSPGAKATSTAAYRAKIEAILTAHKPEALGNVDKLMGQYSGREDALITSLEKMYGPAPATSTPSLIPNGEKEGGKEPFRHPRERCMPHIKSYARYPIPSATATTNCTSTSARPSEVVKPPPGLFWFLLTSSNLSRAAWGDWQKGNTQFMIRSYEMGILFTADRLLEAAAMAASTTTHTMQPEQHLLLDALQFSLTPNRPLFVFRFCEQNSLEEKKKEEANPSTAASLKNLFSQASHSSMCAQFQVRSPASSNFYAMQRQHASQHHGLYPFSLLPSPMGGRVLLDSMHGQVDVLISLFSPYRITNPIPYASTHSLRCGKADQLTMEEMTKDVPWFVDMRFAGVDVVGQKIDAALGNCEFYGLGAWGCKGLMKSLDFSSMVIPALKNNKQRKKITPSISTTEGAPRTSENKGGEKTVVVVEEKDGEAEKNEEPIIICSNSDQSNEDSECVVGQKRKRLAIVQSVLLSEEEVNKKNST